LLDSGKRKIHISTMQLSQHTDYGLRLLIVLARRRDELVALPDFAGSQGISYHHVSKVAQALRRAGFIESRRGRSGGVELARAPEDITIGEVVRALESGLQLAECGTCALRDGCAASPILAEALDAFLAVLDGKTLLDAARTGVKAFAQWTGRGA
jgi:Rrf2 family transcriptional regulator, nitric oxide-sensitive transcriptional repressor